MSAKAAARIANPASPTTGILHVSTSSVEDSVASVFASVTWTLYVVSSSGDKSSKVSSGESVPMGTKVFAWSLNH